MNAGLVFIKMQQRLNKLGSSDYDNLSCWHAREAFNKAQLAWVRRQIVGKNDTQEGDEETKNKVDDIQILLKSLKIEGINKTTYFESDKIPSDYFFIKRVSPITEKDSCSGVRIKSNLREEANVDDYLDDWSMQPSSEFEQTFHTMLGNRIRVYTNNDFKVQHIDLIYYRLPRELDLQGCDRVDGARPRNIDPEFKDDIVEIIIDEAAAILAGDIESPNQVVLNKQRAQQDT